MPTGCNVAWKRRCHAIGCVVSIADRLIDRTQLCQTQTPSLRHVDPTPGAAQPRGRKSSKVSKAATQNGPFRLTLSLGREFHFVSSTSGYLLFSYCGGFHSGNPFVFGQSPILLPMFHYSGHWASGFCRYKRVSTSRKKTLPHACAFWRSADLGMTNRFGMVWEPAHRASSLKTGAVCIRVNL